MNFSLRTGGLFVRSFLCLIFAISIGFHCQTNQEDREAYVATHDGLFLREAPNVESRQLALIPEGAKIELLGKSNLESEISGTKAYWYKTLFSGKQGWVFGGYLLFVRAPEVIHLEQQADILGYRGKVHTEDPPKLSARGGSLLGEKFAIAAFADEIQLYLFLDETLYYAGKRPKKIIRDILRVPNLKSEEKFFYPGGEGNCNNPKYPQQPILAITSNNVTGKCEFKEIQEAWTIDFENRKFEKIESKDIICASICCGGSCL